MSALRMAETGHFRMSQLAAEFALARIELADAKPEDAASWLERAQRTLEATGQRAAGHADRIARELAP